MVRDNAGRGVSSGLDEGLLTLDLSGARAPASAGFSCRDRARPRCGHRPSSASGETQCYAEFLV